MPPKRTKASRSALDKDQPSQELRRSKLLLFIQQFEKEAQQRLNHLEAKLENLLASVDQFFKVELLKMPPALQKTRLGDLIREDDTSANEVSIAMENESREMSEAFRRIPGKKVKSSDSHLAVPTLALESSHTTPMAGKSSKRIRTLVGSNSTGNLPGSSKRPQTRMTRRKITDQTLPNQQKCKLRSVVSAGDLQCSAPGSAAHITVTTARGEMVSFSEETKDDINWDLLDDVARHQIQKLTGLMEYLSRQSRHR